MLGCAVLSLFKFFRPWSPEVEGKPAWLANNRHAWPWRGSSSKARLDSRQGAAQELQKCRKSGVFWGECWKLLDCLPFILTSPGSKWAEDVPDEGVCEEGEGGGEEGSWSGASTGGGHSSAPKKDEPLHQEEQLGTAWYSVSTFCPSDPTSSCAISVESPELQVGLGLAGSSVAQAEYKWTKRCRKESALGKEQVAYAATSGQERVEFPYSQTQLSWISTSKHK